MRPWYSMKATEKGDTAEITIYDAIGASFWDEKAVSAKQFVDDLNGLGDGVDSITLRINSPGGDVFDGVAIHNALKNHKAKVTARVDGIAASIASYIAMAADKIVMPANSFLLLHNASGFSFGNADDMRSVAEDLDRIDKSIIATYATRSGQTASKVKALLKEDRLMDASEAKQLGYADEVVKEVKIAAFSDVAFRLLPKAVADRFRAETGTQQAGNAPPSPAAPQRAAEPATSLPPSPADPVSTPAGQSGQQAAQVIDIGTVKAQGIAEHSEYVSAITDLCTLAGKPELVGSYVRANMKADDVRKELLTQRATEQATILPHHPMVEPSKVSASMWTKITDKLNARNAKG